MLYWCEGDKSKRGRSRKVALTSTDPLLLKLFIYSLKQFYEVDPRELKCRLTIWEGVNEDEAIEFWSQELGIPRENFWKSYVRKPSKIRQGKHPLWYVSCNTKLGKST